MSFDFIKDRNKKIHFIGIGGISMSGIAEILLKNNFKISGSDMNKSHITERLENLGVSIFIGHDKSNMRDADIVVYTAAISNDNPELIQAKQMNIPLFDRAEFLGEIMKGHKYNVAVAGTHGKTTTTSIISHILLQEKVDPTILVGGELDIIDGNVRPGNSEYFLTEACEYKKSFLKFYPYIGIVLNVDADHLDYYKDLNDIKNAFSDFMNLIPKEGYLIANADDKNVQGLLNNLHCNVITFGINNGLYRAKNIKYDENGCGGFDVYENSIKLFSVKLNVPGEHNILNALSSICACLMLKITPESIINGLYSFNGTHRRFELKGVKNNITVIDDYAHHPTEIKAAIKTAKNYPNDKVFLVFQPHTYSRTLTLFDDFTESFYGVDTVILADIYAAREKDTGVISSDMLGDSLREKGLNCINLHSFDDIVDFLNENCKENNLILTVGAGNVYEVGEMFLEK